MSKKNPMHPDLKKQMDDALAAIAPMPTDSAAQPAFDEGGPAYQAEVDRLQKQWMDAVRSRTLTMFQVAHETGGAGLTEDYMLQKRFAYIINFIFPRGSRERLIFEIGWEQLLEREWNDVPNTVRKAREEMQAQRARQLLLGGAQAGMPAEMPPGFGKS